MNVLFTSVFHFQLVNRCWAFAWPTAPLCVHLIRPIFNVFNLSGQDVYCVIGSTAFFLLWLYFPPLAARPSQSLAVVSQLASLETFLLSHMGTKPAWSEYSHMLLWKLCCTEMTFFCTERISIFFTGLKCLIFIWHSWLLVSFALQFQGTGSLTSVLRWTCCSSKTHKQAKLLLLYSGILRNSGQCTKNIVQPKQQLSSFQ